jgi:hypothetical protein
VKGSTSPVLESLTVPSTCPFLLWADRLFDENTRKMSMDEVYRNFMLVSRLVMILLLVLSKA